MAATHLNPHTPATNRLNFIKQSNKELINVLDCPNITNKNIYNIENKAKDILQAQSDTIKYDMIDESIPYMNCSAYSLIEYAALPMHLFLDDDANENLNFDIDEYLSIDFSKKRIVNTYKYQNEKKKKKRKR